jgi:hypothetical protein
MAKVIEFYIPTDYRKAEEVATEERGQVIEFVPRPSQFAGFSPRREQECPVQRTLVDADPVLAGNENRPGRL